MKRREVSDRHFSSFPSHFYLSQFRTDFICNEANSKLYFLLHKTSSAAKMLAPQGGRKSSEVGLLIRIISGNDYLGRMPNDGCTTKKSDV
jgi:hypothetical protein